jgi:beta-galactosidase
MKGEIRNPLADDLVTFAVSGPASIVAVDNGDRAAHESFQACQRHAYRGRAVAIVKWNGPGKIKVTASAPGLIPASLRIPE